jgi:hypothetical protein
LIPGTRKLSADTTPNRTGLQGGPAIAIGTDIRNAAAAAT